MWTDFQNSFTCFKILSPGERMLKSDPHLSELLLNIYGLLFWGHSVYIVSVLSSPVHLTRVNVHNDT